MEKARIESCTEVAAEVRMLAPDHFRIYLRGEDAPGLTMGRCFGDFVLSPAIVDTPEYKKLEMSDGSPWWAVVASAHSRRLRMLISSTVSRSKIDAIYIFVHSKS